MQNENVIRIDDLRKKINLILSHISVDLGKEEVCIENNYYWSILEEDLYHLNNPPSELAVGSLEDDLEFLASMSNEREQAVSIMLLHVAPLLRYLADKVGQ